MRIPNDKPAKRRGDECQLTQKTGALFGLSLALSTSVSASAASGAVAENAATEILEICPDFANAAAQEAVEIQNGWLDFMRTEVKPNPEFMNGGY